MRQFKRVFAPALTDVTVEWGQAGATPASDHVPPVFDGERMAIYALIDGPRAATAKLSGTLAGRAVAFEVSVDPERAVQGDTIATLAARHRIRTLEEQGEYLENRGSRQRRTRANTGAAAEIAALGVKYQLCSRETSFVAIEHRETPAEGRAELRRVPVALTSGWGGVREQGVGMATMCMDVLSLGAQRSAAPAGPGRVWSHVQDLMAGPADVYSAEATGEFDAAPAMSSRPSFMRRVPAATRDSSRPHDRLISLQRADGSWDLTDEFARAVSMKLRNLEKALRDAIGDPEIARRALATAIAIAWLERHAGGTRHEWEMLAEKAGRWIEACRTAPREGTGWNAWVERARLLV
jgi:hypothetical protein